MVLVIGVAGIFSSTFLLPVEGEVMGEIDVGYGNSDNDSVGIYIVIMIMKMKVMNRSTSVEMIENFDGDHRRF